MLRQSLFTLFIVSLLISGCANVGDAPEAETTTAVPTETAEETAFTGNALSLTPENSDINFTAAKVTRTHQGGFNVFNGTIYVDGTNVTGLEITIDASSIFTDTDRLTEHLKSDDFFDVAVFPEAHFEANSFEPIADGTDGAGATHSVTGTLTIRDQANQIIFPAALEVSVDSVSASADFIIDRQLWGLSYPGAPDDLIRDDVRIKLAVSASQTAENGPEE